MPLFCAILPVDSGNPYHLEGIGEQGKHSCVPMAMQDSVYGFDHDEVGKIAARAPKRKAAEPENASAMAASRDWQVKNISPLISQVIIFLAAVCLLGAVHPFWQHAIGGKRSIQSAGYRQP